ncbi:MAG TPA: phosphoglucomutase (alpha-D-glucose-1,6-bisphosphate-dependent) [Opitutaceae bacterium]|jgi:phosphoglucomutase
MRTSPLAGKPAAAGPLVDIPRLVTAYYTLEPDPAEPSQRVAFGTSGHRGSSLSRSFNEAHILAITQAICLFRHRQGTSGPLFIGADTHALSAPAHATALEVLAANGVEVVVADKDEYTPTPVISHAILAHNASGADSRADGIVITPSHNPPQDGGFKYNPPTGGPADTATTAWIEAKANELLEARLGRVRRIPLERAQRAPTTHAHDYISPYVADLADVVDMDAIRGAKMRIGVDPLGGAGVHYWPRISDEHRLGLTIVSDEVDPTFRFMTRDWDGQVRMDPSSAYAMQRLIGMRDRFDLSFGCDTDHDRHGIVTRSVGLMPANHFLCAAIHHLFTNRPGWPRGGGVGKTVVSSQMIDRVARRLGRPLVEVPVGFKWFVQGLGDSAINFAGEESAGASFSRTDGRAWTTDKDGFIACLLAAEASAKAGRDPGQIYAGLAAELGEPVYDRVEAPATRGQKEALSRLSPASVGAKQLAGEPITALITKAPGNGADIGGLKVVSEGGWFAARPSGTEDVYKIYAESFRGREHLDRIIEEAQALVTQATGPAREPASPVNAAAASVKAAMDNMRNEGDPN